MTAVFIGGSRKVSRLAEAVRDRLQQVIQNQLAVMVGDANGADRIVQSFFSEKRYADVTVYCTGGTCRNNVGGWPVIAIDPPHRTRDFEYFTAKDAAMARKADYGLMLWDGESSGTVVNAARLLASKKPTVIYMSPRREFLTLRTPDDLRHLLDSVRPDINARVNESISEHAPEFLQPSILGAG